MLPQNAENLAHIPCGGFPNGGQVVLLNVCRTKPQHPVDDGVVHRGVVGSICATAKGYEYLCEMALRKGGVSHAT